MNLRLNDQKTIAFQSKRFFKWHNPCMSLSQDPPLTPSRMRQKLNYFLTQFTRQMAVDSSSGSVQHFVENQSYFKSIKKAFNPFTFKSGGWLESTGKWTLLWVSKEVPAPGRCQLVKVKTKSGERLTAWKC